jgi:lipopolysaccharide export system protein LptC
MTSASLVLSSRSEDARARAFAAARLHTAHVRWARRALVFGVVAAIVGFAALGLYRNFRGALRDVTFEGIGIEGGRITMDKPHLSGARPGGGGYDITAVKAMQDARHPGDVDLAFIGGEIATPDREVSRLSAESGHYESVNETLDLAGNVQLKNPRYEIFLRSVHIEFKAGAYVSNEPVNVRILPDTTIAADAFTAKDGGSEVHFEGHVRTTVNAADGQTP